jgi:16S rRNA (cytosine967-C5)-methyltransferase
MKLHKNLVNEMALTLKEIFTGKQYADKAIERLFKRHGAWGSRDRRFVSEGIYEVVRNYRLYATLAGTPDNFWLITGIWLLTGEHEIPDWQEFKHLNRESLEKRKAQFKSELPIFESYPDWLWKLGIDEAGQEIWEREARAMNQQAPVFLRTNTLKTTRDALIAALLKENIETVTVEDNPEALQLVKRANVFQSRLFKEGNFEVQDAGSQIISRFLNPIPGERVIDACAGAGGKSLHLAALMRNKGRIISMDTEAWKLQELKKRATRASAFNIEPRHIESSKTIKSLESSADKLLLDVPCSGLGVIKRNPDTKWKLTPEAMEKARETQAKILSEYPSMLKPGGMMLYSTCSILPSENQNQISKFLAANSNFKLIKEQTIYPHQGSDGFYMALVERLK